MSLSKLIRMERSWLSSIIDENSGFSTGDKRYARLTGSLRSISESALLNRISFRISEVSILDAGCWMLDARSSILDARCSILDPRSLILDSRFSILDPRFSILDPRFSILDPRSSILDFRPSILDPRSSILDPRFSESLHRTKINTRNNKVMYFRIGMTKVINSP